MANSIGDWFKRYKIWLILIAITVVVFALWMFLPTGDKGALKILKDTEDKVNKLKEAKVKELEVITEEMDERVEELMEIKAEPDEDKRLQALADFANRRRARARG